MKYRSRTEIIFAILNAAKEPEGVPKTRIMFEAYLSFAQLKDYLATVLQSELIEHDKETNRYMITAKGIKMLEACQRVSLMTRDHK